MKIIGTFKDCVHWQAKEATSPEPVDPEKFAIQSAHIRANYQLSTAEERLIDDIRAENDCAFQKIASLSEALADLGIDPTQI